MINDAKRLAAQHFGCDSDDMRAVAHVTNNSVFTFSSGGKPYIFKFYKSKWWPENGKLPFVMSKLKENSIPCADIVIFTRDDPDYPNGYLIETMLDGTAADKANFNTDARTELFSKLAVFMSRVHAIPLGKFGYIGDGTPYEDSMCDFFADEFDERAEKLIEKEVFNEEEVAALKAKFFSVLENFNDLPSVLCHGDLSDKNILMQNDGSIILIDWDDAMAYCWMADVSRFTFWLKTAFAEEDATLCRRAFLDNYITSHRKDEFDAFEEGFHIYIAVDFLAYYLKTDNIDMQRRLADYLRSRL